MGNMSRRWLVCVITSCVLIVVLDSTQLCRRRAAMARAEQSDQNGLICWDHVKMSYCGGACDSREISDWMFPYKLSYHHVCLYSSWRPLAVKLRHCDEGVQPGTELFHYVVADKCHCKVCSSQHTSCEWLPPNSTMLKDIISYEDGE